MKKFILVSIFFLFSQNVYSNTWTIEEQKDDFAGTTIKYATSNPVKPNAPLDFPYQNLTASYIKVCGDKTRGIIYFTEDPNLIDGELSDNYSTFNVDVKIDGKFDTISIQQDWGSKYLYIQYDNNIRIRNADEFMIQLKHYGGTRHYKFNLSGIPC